LPIIASRNSFDIGAFETPAALRIQASRIERRLDLTLGLESDQLKLLQEHDAWASEFARERQRIAEVLRPYILGIEHVGSTALPSIPAKPVLNILIEVPSFERARATIAPMEFLGYEHRDEYGIPRRHYFVKGNTRTHHVHMLEMGGETWRNMLVFRDALLARPSLAQQ
jgi:GrpB-like predicted nucleotidyltransferase (UPF0157 family)